MPSSKTPVKVRLHPEMAQKLHNLHPGYGEVSGVVAELLAAYLAARQSGSSEAQAVMQVVKERTA